MYDPDDAYLCINPMNGNISFMSDNPVSISDVIPLYDSEYAPFYYSRKVREKMLSEVNNL